MARLLPSPLLDAIRNRSPIRQRNPCSMGGLLFSFPIIFEHMIPDVPGG